ncbi:MAG TPA: hypothetical protein VJT68_02395 [Thermoleophilaceae bacterium]|nr:hypothetical protein [Thermoleophilaceae bacterium]
MNTTHVEHDALAALRAELTMAAGRRIRRRHARRRTVVIVALIALLLAATAATAALVRNTTGVPAIDQLLDIEVPGAHTPAGSGDATRPLAVRMGDGIYQVVAYLARDGGVCIATAQAHRGGVRGGFGGCPSLDYVNRRVERRGAVGFGSSHGVDERTYQLIVGGDVESVRPLEKGDWTIKMTLPWTPRARGARPLRLVVAIDDEDLLEIDRVSALFPKLELRYANGERRVARP